MALSNFGKDKTKVSTYEWETKSHADSKGEKNQEVPMVQVMLIDWDGPVARQARSISLTGLRRYATSEWKTIILQ